MKTIGQRLKETRKLQGYTLEQVGRAIKISPTTISKYEANRVNNIPQKNLEKLAGFLKVNPSYLLGYEDEEHSSASQLSLNEQMMIDDFRELSPPYQQIVLRLVASLKEAQGESDEYEQLTL